MVAQLHKLLVDLTSIRFQMVEEALFVDLLFVVVIRLFELVRRRIELRLFRVKLK